MKITKTQLRQMIKEELEDGDPISPMVYRVVALENDMFKLLSGIYDGQSQIPIEVLNAMEALMDSIKIDQ